tara:strand:+ start:322 stop:942 length:621 start_codon:yes stop_codon:yes gene_type:complete
MKIDVIDIQIGNISSIENWLTSSNLICNKVTDPMALENDLIILPGVGSAKMYSKKLKQTKFDIAIKNHLKNGGRLIGICLGFQILFDFLEEDGGIKGLGVLNGKVIRLKEGKSHTGWENFIFHKDKLHSFWRNNQVSKSKKRIIKGRVFYNHNYGVVLSSEDFLINSKIPNYEAYSSYIISKQIVGFQFHPEKSQLTGKELIKILY